MWHLEHFVKLQRLKQNFENDPLILKNNKTENNAMQSKAKR